MTIPTRFLLAILAATSWAQVDLHSQSHVPVSAAAATNLPVRPIGLDDLLGISVYDCLDLTRTVRVELDGSIRLPMVKRHIAAAGLLPAALESAISDALRAEQIMVDPIVTVSIVESESRPVSVVGAVRKPITFQATGGLTLIDALSRADGLAQEAGPEIIVSRVAAGGDGKPYKETLHILAKALFSGADPKLNLSLQGGEVVDVPVAAKVYVLGAVTKPGAFPVLEANEASVLRAVALSEGLLPFASRTAYIYRNGTKIPVEINDVLKGKTADVPLLANDALFIPDRGTERKLVHAVELLSSGIGSALLYVAGTR